MISIHHITFQKTVVISHRHENIRFTYFLNHVSLHYPPPPNCTTKCGSKGEKMLDILRMLKPRYNQRGVCVYVLVFLRLWKCEMSTKFSVHCRGKSHGLWARLLCITLCFSLLREVLLVVFGVLTLCKILHDVRTQNVSFEQQLL